MCLHPLCMSRLFHQWFSLCPGLLQQPPLILGEISVLQGAPSASGIETLPESPADVQPGCTALSLALLP